MPEAKPRMLAWPEGLRNFLELCLSSYIQAVLELPQAGTRLKKRPFGTDLGKGSFRVLTLQGLYPGSLESGQIRLTDGPWFTDRQTFLWTRAMPYPRGIKIVFVGPCPCQKLSQPHLCVSGHSSPFLLWLPRPPCVTNSAHSEL